jgi:hypothetical protein
MTSVLTFEIVLATFKHYGASYGSCLVQFSDHGSVIKDNEVSSRSLNICARNKVSIRKFSQGHAINWVYSPRFYNIHKP